MFALFRLARPYRGRVGLILLLALIQSMANLFLPRLMGEVVDHGIVTGDTAAIVRAGALMLLMALGATACAVAGSYHSAQVATGLGRIVRGEVFSRVARYSVHQFAERGSASLVTRTTNDTAQVQQMLIMLLNTVITAPMMAIGGVLLALSQDATLAGVLGAFTIPVLPKYDPAALSVRLRELTDRLERSHRGNANLLLNDELNAAVQAMEQVYRQFQAQGSSAGGHTPLYDFADLTRLMGFEDVWAFEKRYAETD